MVSHFRGDATFDDVIAAAGVELDPKGLYFAKPYRNCQSQAAFCGAVRMALTAKDSEINRLNAENARLADRHSQEAAKRATLAEENSKLTRTAIKRGLEGTTLAVAERERIVDVSRG